MKLDPRSPAYGQFSFPRGMLHSDKFWAVGFERTDSGCWEWYGRRNDKGYGIFVYPDGQLAHRFSYAYFYHESPGPGQSVMHSCDNPPCVNPAHLSLGTHAENMGQAARRGRFPVAKLTEQDVREIRALCQTESINSIARKYGIVSASVRAIRDRRNWKWVSDNENEGD